MELTSNQLQNPIRIPEQLKDWNFVLVAPRSKQPIEKDWPNKPRRYDDSVLLAHIANGGNYGVMGSENQIIIDADTQEVREIVEKNLPETFTVLSPGHKNPHFYYKCNLSRPIRLSKKEDKKFISNVDILDKTKNVGDVQGVGKQVVGPGCMHPNGGQYIVIKDLPVAGITAEQLTAALAPFILDTHKENVQDVSLKARKSGIENDLKLEQIVSPASLQKHGDQYFGAHPVHGSESGSNFWVNLSKGVWHCFRHGTGGGSWQLFAVQEGIIDCSEATPGKLRGNIFRKLLHLAEQKQLVLLSKHKVSDDAVVRKPFFEAEGKLFQQIAGGGFCVWDGTSYSNVNNCVLDGVTYCPNEGDEVQNGFVLLAEKPEPSGTLSELVDSIVKFSEEYVDILDDFRRFAAYYCVFTWVYDRFNTTPYLRFLGDTGCGKSRSLDVFGSVCYNFIKASGAMTVAPVFRIIQKWRPTLGFEEADFKSSEETNPLIKIINCGIERGRPVLRCQENNSDNIQFFDAFGAKIFATRHPFEDPATESRCLSTTMKETTRELPPELPPKFFEEAKKLRNRLLDFRLKNWKTYSTVIDPIFPRRLEPRLKQMASPLLPLFTDETDKQNFFSFLLGYQKKLLEERATSWTGQVLQTLLEKAKDEQEGVSAKSIADALACPSSRVTREVKALGFQVEHRHKKVTDGDETKRKSFRAWVCSNEVWLTLRSRYPFEELQEDCSEALTPQSARLLQQSISAF